MNKKPWRYDQCKNPFSVGHQIKKLTRYHAEYRVVTWLSHDKRWDGSTASKSEQEPRGVEREMVRLCFHSQPVCSHQSGYLVRAPPLTCASDGEAALSRYTELQKKTMYLFRSFLAAPPKNFSICNSPDKIAKFNITNVNQSLCRPLLLQECFWK